MEEYIKLNEYYHNYGGGYAQYEGIFAHEVGHFCGLDHYSDGLCELLSEGGGNYYKEPQLGDIAGINNKYK